MKGGWFCFVSFVLISFTFLRIEHILLPLWVVMSIEVRVRILLKMISKEAAVGDPRTAMEAKLQESYILWLV